MRVLTNKEVQLMENLVGVTQESLRSVLYKYLKQHYKKVIYDDAFLIAHGDIPIALVAHMDTVFKSPADELFYDRKKNVMWSPTGMGADDRAGIFAIIQIIRSGLRPHVIFTTDEEIGCIGAGILAEKKCPFEDLRYIIQLDRRNGNDCVFYDCDNPEFEKYVESFGFVTAYGSFTDISELCPEWEIAGVNLSIGYRDEHSVSEVLFVGQMLSTIEKVKRMLTVDEIPSFKFIPSPEAYYGMWYRHYNHANSGYPGYYDSWIEEDDYLIPKGRVEYKCHICGKTYDGDQVLPVKLIKGGVGFFCENCLANHIDWCKWCGEAFEIDPKHPDEEMCPDCRKKGKSKGKSKFRPNKKSS